MQLLGILEIKSKDKIKEFLNNESTGRIASLDEDGYPQIIPMNFVFAVGARRTSCNYTFILRETINTNIGKTSPETSKNNER